MKLAVVLGLLAVAFASQQWETRHELIHEQSFKAGKHYSFKFDGQVSSGLPIPSSSQHSATRIQSLLSVVFENDRQVLLKLQKIRLGSAHRDLVEPREVQPFELFQEVELTKEQLETLVLPLRFRYDNGLISEIEFDQEEQTWSANIKRAVLNMLQLNLSKKSRTDKSEISRILRDSNENKEWPEKDFFSTQEMTLEGDCEASYTVVPTEEKKLRVSKSVNFEKCSKRMDTRYNFRFGEECPSCEKKFNGEEQNTESSTVIDFELNGNTESWLIREVSLRSQYIFGPLSKEQQLMATFVANKLTLLSINEDIDSVRGPSSPLKKESLVFSSLFEERLEKFRMTGDESLLRHSPYLWMNKKMEIVKPIIEYLRDSVLVDLEKEDIEPEVVRQIARLVEVLRVCTVEEIRKIGHLMTEEDKLRKVFYDVLAEAGTKNTIEYLTKEMVERRMTVIEEVKALKMIMSIRNPSHNIVDLLIHLSKEEVISKNPALKQSLWLTIGGLMNGVCGEHRDRLFLEKESVCPRDIKEKFVEILDKLFDKAETTYEKHLALKTIANSGMDLIVFPLEKIIKNEKEEKTVRLGAIDALRKLRTVMPRKIQSILMPLYKNIRESPEIRMSAFNQIMHTLPERVVIDQITSQLEKEPSTYVHSFVYSTLLSLAKTDIPCEKDMARDIEYSLKLARIQPRKMIDSTTLRSSFYMNEYYTGATLNWASIFSNDSILPKELMASLDTVYAGEWSKYLAQIGFSQENLDQLLFKLIEKLENNEFDLEEVVLRGERSTVSVKQSIEVLKKLVTKMGITHRRQAKREAHAHMYLRYKDMDYVVLPFEEKTIDHFVKEVIKGGKFDIEEILSVLAKGYRFDVIATSFVYEKTRTIATTIGMPLEITGKMPTLAMIDGEIKVDYSKGLRLHLKAQPKIVSTHVMHMELRSPLLSQGVKILHSATFATPLDLIVDATFDKKMDIKMTIRAPESKESKRVLSLHTRPVTYVRFESKHKKFESALEKTIVLPQQPIVEMKKVYGEDILGLKFIVHGNVHRHLIEKMEPEHIVALLVTENNMEVRMEKTEETPREWVVRLAVDPIQWVKTMSALPEMDSFYNKETRPHFTMDTEYEEERQDEFTSYLKNYKKNEGYTHRMHMKFETIGSSTERRAEMELRSECEKTFSFCKWTLSSTRSPLLKGEKRQWEMHATLQTLLPKSIVSIDQLKVQKHREMNVILDAEWGSNEKNTLTLRLQGEQSTEQKKWQELVLRKNEKITPLSTLERLELASRLNQIKIVADYKIEPETLVQFYRLSTLLKAYYPYSSILEVREPREYSKEGRLLAKLTVEPQTWRYLNLSVEIPSERIVIENIRLPFRPTFMTIHKNPESLIHSFSSKCEVSSSRVNTFDEIIYRAPLTTCYSVLAKDCTEEPNFAVLMKKISKHGEEKKMKIVTQDNTIEIENKKGDFIVKVDNKIVKEDKLSQWGLEKIEDVIVFENVDIFVRFDGYKAEIKMNELYKNKQCGMCGHYDGERKGEFRRADDEETDDIEEFHRSFLSRDDECEVEEEKLSEKKNYKKYDEFEMNEESEDSYEMIPEEHKRRNKYSKYEDEEEKMTVEPIEKTHVIEYSHRICFSKLPVPECPHKTMMNDEDTKDMKVTFSCLERSSSKAGRLLRQSRKNILDVEDLPVSFTETITIPKTCTVY